MEYNHEQAVADGVNVGFDVYKIRTYISEHGSAVEAGLYIDKRDRQTRKIRWERLEDSANLPDPDVIAAEIAEDLEAALLQFSQIAADLKK